MAFDDEEFLWVTDGDSREVFVFNPAGLYDRRILLDAAPTRRLGWFSWDRLRSTADGDCNDDA